MTIALAILGSSSSGNAALLRLAGRRHVLIDAGFSPRRTRLALEELGVTLDDLDAIIVTHLDHDHLHRGWAKAVRDLAIEIVVSRGHQNRAVQIGIPVPKLRIVDGGFDLCGVARVETAHLAHDQLGSVGFVVECGGCRLGWATDLGRVTSALYDRFVDLDAIALESNYDRQMQLDSDRPLFLRNRIMGGAGHLSNDQALEAIKRIDARSRLGRIVLLHLSRDCNHPDAIRALYAKRAPKLAGRLLITEPDMRTEFLDVQPVERPAQQLALFEA